MSQFCTMTTRERKIQAAAICREILGPEDAAEIDLGKKVSAPKDIMFEELSLASNRGSRLFKMRQRRSEKYTFESIRNETNIQINNGVTLLAQSDETTGTTSDEKNMGVDGSPKTPPNTPDPRTAMNPENLAPGYGGPLKDIPPEKFNSTCVPRSYYSPWDQAINNDPTLAGTLLTHMPEPEPQCEVPGYKSFNRVATPFGGFNKTRPSMFKAPEVDPGPAADLPDYSELQGDAGVKRPTFNRAAVGWVSVGGPLNLSAVPKEPMFIPESDDL